LLPDITVLFAQKVPPPPPVTAVGFGLILTTALPFIFILQAGEDVVPTTV
jgi:hypothetical protein